MTEEKTKEEKEETKESKENSKSKFKDLVEQIESLSVAELSELVKELEERFGVSAASMVAPVAAPAPAAGGEGGAQTEEKARYTVVLSAAGANKIAVIKAVRELKPDLGLKDAKDFVEGAPKTLLEDVPKEDAEKAKKKLEEAGATVELK